VDTVTVAGGGADAVTVVATVIVKGGGAGVVTVTVGPGVVTVRGGSGVVAVVVVGAVVSGWVGVVVVDPVPAGSVSVGVAGTVSVGLVGAVPVAAAGGAGGAGCAGVVAVVTVRLVVGTERVGPWAWPDPPPHAASVSAGTARTRPIATPCAPRERGRLQPGPLTGRLPTTCLHGQAQGAGRRPRLGSLRCVARDARCSRSLRRVPSA